MAKPLRMLTKPAEPRVDRRGYWGVALVALLIVAAGLFILAGLPALRRMIDSRGDQYFAWEQERRFEVKAKANQTITVDVKSVKGPSPGVKVYIAGREEETLFAGQRIDGTGQVTATAPEDGTYYVGISNSYMPEGERVVDFTYSVK